MNVKGYSVTTNGTFQVRVGSKNSRIYLGTFNTKEEAISAYRAYVSSIGKIEGKIIDLTGKKFERLTVISYAGVTNKNQAGRWLCECDCGSNIIVRTSALNNKTTKSCGCLKKQRLGEAIRKDKGVASFNRVLRYYKKNATRRGLSFNLTEEKFKEIIVLPCYYCNSDPQGFFKRVDDNGYFLYNGIDRINSFEGYKENNCLPCCVICNRAKSNMTYDEFIKYLDRLTLKMGKVFNSI